MEKESLSKVHVLKCIFSLPNVFLLLKKTDFNNALYQHSDIIVYHEGKLDILKFPKYYEINGSERSEYSISIISRSQRQKNEPKMN